MKIIKARIKKHRTEERTSFNYPIAWDAPKINVLAFEDSDNMGDVVEHCVGLVHDDVYAEVLLEDPDVREIDESEANEFGRKYKPTKMVLDDGMLPDVLAALNKDEESRTPDEKSMLDVNNPAPGLRQKEFNVKNWYSE